MLNLFFHQNSFHFFLLFLVSLCLLTEYLKRKIINHEKVTIFFFIFALFMYINTQLYNRICWKGSAWRIKSIKKEKERKWWRQQVVHEVGANCNSVSWMVKEIGNVHKMLLSWFLFVCKLFCAVKSGFFFFHSNLISSWALIKMSKKRNIWIDDWMKKNQSY